MEVVVAIFRVWAVYNGTLLELLRPWRWRHIHYQYTRRHIPQDLYLHQYRCENLRYPVITCGRNDLHTCAARSFSISRHVIHLTANTWNVSNKQMVRMCVCLYSLHVLCTGCLWHAPSWIASAQLCAPLLGSTCWIVCPSLERNERGINIQNKMGKTKAENQHRQTKEW
jgi:hypothetical protein